MHHRFALMIALSALAACSARSADTGSFEKSLKPFLAKHCVDCHGSEVQKARLRLDNLPPDFKTHDVAEVWIKAFDKVHQGQMPPATEERPTADELAAATSFLKKELHQASLAHQRSEGRVSVRRLNRTEYDYTLSDLLEMNVEVKDLLPDDNVVAGFDNISEGLDISSAHFLRYQEAADKALHSAIPLRPKSHSIVRKTAQQLVDGNQALKKAIGSSVEMRDQTLVTFIKQQRYSGLIFPSAPTSGIYKVRVSAYAVNTNGASTPLVFLFFNDGVRNEGEARAVLNVPADKATVLEIETYLRFQDKLNFNGWALPYDNDIKSKTKDGLKNYTGPGLAIEWIELEGPINEIPGPGYRRLFGDTPLKARSVVEAEKKNAKPPTIKDSGNEYQWLNNPLIPVSADPQKDAERLIKEFATRALRRPANDGLISYFTGFATDRLNKGYLFRDAVLTAYKAVLCSPHFLLFNELPGKLDDYAVAARLSYFLWRSMPDQALLDLAAKGTLSKKEVLLAQVERMLADQKAERFVDDFTGQWLELRKINATSPDPQLYGEFDQYLLWSMPQETRLFFSEILKNDLSVTEFIHSDWTFVNERLAQHYGIKGVAGKEMRKVTLAPELHRGGVLTQGSVLKVTADGTRTSPILRGKWVLEHIIGLPPSPPPPDIPSIEPDIRGATTIRQQLEKHRDIKACASCHMHIDPPGFALETYDVIGGWREFYRVAKQPQGGKKLEQVALENYPSRKTLKGLPVEKGDKTPDGRPFKDIDEYKQILLSDKDQLARNVVQKLMVFATGADLQFADREVVEEIVASVRKNNYGLRSILKEIVCSRVFLNK
ncbi:MAG TPA: DUF1592 domain-containing protein [Planctomycetota bacterium]|nr:DUF1592 domain-containing protein [Planctomycetota bacterium]